MAKRVNDRGVPRVSRVQRPQAPSPRAHRIANPIAAKHDRPGEVALEPEPRNPQQHERPR